MKKLLSLFLFIIGVSQVLFAHAPEQGYIFLRVYERGGIEGRFEILASDLNKVFDWQLKDKENSLASIQKHYTELQQYALEKSNFSSKFGKHTITFEKVDIFRAGLGDYIQVFFKLENTEILPDSITVTYDLIFDKSPKHRGYLVTEYNWKAGVINNESNISLSFKPGETTKSMSLTEVSVWKGVVAMIKQGVWHIWIGLDHILFLVALILPAVVRRNKQSTSISNHWMPVTRFRPAFIYILKIVTFFTIAHTITLSLAALQIIVLPSWIVESIIAFSIGLAAFHNIKPIFKGKDWVIAFIFGLFHGFGFASVLGDIGLKDDFLIYSLLGFNVGVELGQLAIIIAIFPILYFLRKLKLYPKLVFYGSILLIIISLYWVIERVFDVNLGVEDFIRGIIYNLFFKE